MTIKPNKKLLVMAGGTGGHVFPALAVAKQLQQHGWEIRWLGTADRMEATLVPQHGIEIDFIKVKGLRGQGIVNLLKAPFQIINAVFQARRHIKAWQPDVVLGMGGYVSGPGGMAAWLSGIPLLLHEQNAVAGLTNQWLSKIAKTVMQAFPGAFPKAEVVGNPVRQDVTILPEPKVRLSDRNDDIRILVMGGSQGARILNHTLPVVMEKLALNNLTEGFAIRHQSGKGQKEEVDGLYQQHNVSNYQVTEFIDDMAEAYAWADIVVCRSGALTVSEIAAVGVAAVFIPFMHKDRQQALNADHLVDAGAAIMIEQPDLTPEKLTQALQSMTRERLLDMAEKARSKAIIDADIRVAKALSDAIKS